jgi:hypothetical protein
METFSLPAKDVTRVAGWFYDPRLNAPGTYRLQVLFLAETSESQVEVTTASLAEGKLPIRAVSAETILTVSEPTGDDAILWEELINLAEKRGCSNSSWSPRCWTLLEEYEVTKKAVEKYPSSSYTAYMLPNYHVASISDLAFVERAVDAQSRAANRDYLRLFVAQSQVRVAKNYSKGQAEQASELLAKAQLAFQALILESKDADIRELSRREIKSTEPDSTDLK